MSEEFALCWNNFTDNIVNGFSTLLVQGDSLCDCTLAVEGKLLKAHKIILSISSPYFKTMFSTNPCQHPIIFLKDMSAKLVQNLLEFIYLGKTNVRQNELKIFMDVAESLQVKGLSTSQKEAKEAIESLMENHTREISNGSESNKRTHSQTEVSEEPHTKEPKLEEITDLTEEDDCGSSMNDTDSIPLISMVESRFDESKSRECQSGLKITSIVSANQFDFGSSKSIDIPCTSSCPNTDVVMYSSTSLLYDDCIFNRNNIVATQQGLKTYWLCKSYRISMCKARCITHQGKVISATGIHNHPPHTSQKSDSQHAFNQLTNPTNDFYNHSIPTTSSQHPPPLIQPYPHFLQPQNAISFPRSPNMNHQNLSPSGNFKMENI